MIRYLDTTTAVIFGVTDTRPHLALPAQGSEFVGKGLDVLAAGT